MNFPNILIWFALNLMTIHAILAININSIISQQRQVLDGYILYIA